MSLLRSLNQEGQAAIVPIELERVSKWHGPVLAVNDVSLQVRPGITALLGPNGAGKSTLVSLITGLLKPSAGRALLWGEPVREVPAVRRRLGFCPQADAFPGELRVGEFVHAMARLSGLSRLEARLKTEEVLAQTGMSAHSEKLLRAGSKGMRQRAKVAQALVHDPDVLVLDEPMTGVDPYGRMELSDLLRGLRDQGKTLLVSSHILGEVETLADRVILVARGRLVADSPVGGLRDLMAERPLLVRLTCRGRRPLAQALLECAAVSGVTLADAPEISDVSPEGGAGYGALIVEIARPNTFYRQLPHILADLDASLERMETLEASMETVFDYLVGAGHERSYGYSRR